MFLKEKSKWILLYKHFDILIECVAKLEFMKMAVNCLGGWKAIAESLGTVKNITRDYINNLLSVTNMVNITYKQKK